jgi:hypothetical protein
VDLDHDPNATRYVDREWIQEYRDEDREQRWDFDGNFHSIGWTVRRTWYEQKRSFATRLSRLIEKRAIHDGDQIPDGAIVAAGIAMGAGGIVVGATVGGMAAAAGAVGVGAVVAGPIGAAVGLVVATAISLTVIAETEADRQIGWEEKWQDWELVTGFDEHDPPTERRVGPEYFKIEKC